MAGEGSSGVLVERVAGAVLPIECGKRDGSAYVHEDIDIVVVFRDSKSISYEAAAYAPSKLQAAQQPIVASQFKVHRIFMNSRIWSTRLCLSPVCAVHNVRR